MALVSRLAGFTDEASDSIEGQIAALKALGWSAMELRAVDHVPAHDLPEAGFEHVLEKLEEANITVCSLGSTIANWGHSVTAPFEETKRTVLRTIPRMQALGTKLVRVMSYSILTDSDGRVLDDQQEAERFRRMRWICDAFHDAGVTAVHENCFTYGGLSWEHSLRLCEAVPHLRLVFDTGNPPIDIDARTPFPYARQDSLEFYEHVKELVVHVHIKDSCLDAQGNERFFFPGEGEGHVAEIVARLEQDGYDGWYSMEPHMAVVFHNSSVQATEEQRSSNFIAYGRKFEQLFRRACGSENGN